ncbi:AAA family ATPase [Aliiglaciecola sp. LCG003]|uniref:AAA family ATPase n=1 Tax=Aliiglaciecola sp. LCG003 TaxID=3053655 RepID=UPI0025741FFC|nr:AAA family ATPase [Aliiglaciecola sp. LCG003]WJG08686.1 AAA family ATPase [Aliiglaciecola sp. LCG003]
MTDVGFTLGKFAPFHKGHEYLIRTALEHVKQLIVVIYPCKELAHISLNHRANWIRALFPQVTVIEAKNGPQVQGYTQQIMDIQNRFLSSLLKDYKFDYFFSSEPYGEHVSKALNCQDFRVDMHREHVPISATQIRQNIIQHKHFLSTEVYVDLFKKVVLLGAPSTGKSTLAAALAKRYETQWVEEYGREYWLEHQVDRRLSPEQLLHIAQMQNQWEDEQLKHANQFLICDTNAFTTWHFALHYHGKALPELEALAQQSWQRYDLVVLCDDSIPYDDTWERSGDANRKEFQQFLIDYMHKHNKPYILAKGDLQQRLKIVSKALEHLENQHQGQTETDWN